ncbi:MAG: hypothetical protein R3E39_05580 [Anaerolineae bacterium]
MYPYWKDAEVNRLHRLELLRQAELERLAQLATTQSDRIPVVRALLERVENVWHNYRKNESLNYEKQAIVALEK